MNLHSPIGAMLWENWRLTRVEAAQRMGLGIVAGAAALSLFDAGATIAFWILVVVHAVFWLSIAKLNGGRLIDGYKPGFPLYLLYTRPVPTVVIVGVAMAYDAISGAALYLASAALLGFVFGQPLPLLSVATWIFVFHLICTAIQWSTRNRVAQWIGSFVVPTPAVILLQHRVTSPLQVEFSLAENALMILIGIVSFGVAVAGVARQRRGDALATVHQPSRSSGYPDWLIALFRFSCPTASATRAQLWFELKSSGLPVLAIGLVLALMIPLLFAIGIPLAPVRPFAILAVMISAPAMLLLLGGNAFGIRRRQGRTYASAFEATQPCDTSRLAGLKLLVRTACVLGALIAVGVSVWASSSLVAAWAPWVVEGKADAALRLVELRSEVGDAFAGLTGHALAAQAVVTSIGVAIILAWLAADSALRARYPRSILVARSMLLFYCLALIVLAVAEKRGMVSAFLLDATLMATSWIATAATVFATLYLLWSGFAERTLTTRYIFGALVISAAFGAAWLIALQGAGAQLGGTLATGTVWILSPVLLPLMASVLAPWSLNRIRHT